MTVTITLPMHDTTGGKLSDLVIAAMADNDAKSAPNPDDPTTFLLTMRKNDKFLADLMAFAIKRDLEVVNAKDLPDFGPASLITNGVEDDQAE